MDTSDRTCATRDQAEAAYELLTCLKLFADADTSVVREILGDEAFVQWEHYPPNDVFDPETRSQYYFHAHPPEGRETPDYGHFHTFLRRPLNETSDHSIAGSAGSDSGDGIFHLVAISLDAHGMPWRLFTTNKWVTGETWCSASRAIAMLNEFKPGIADPANLVSRWMTAMIQLFRPEIETILDQRDRTVAQWQLDHPGTDALEDRALEITAAVEISIHDQVAWIDETYIE